MKATFNITSNRFKFYPGEERLSEEQNQLRKRYNFNWYPGQKCFSAIWTPQAEDWILSFGIEIEEDDTFDDVEGRVKRYQKYAENDERDAEHAQERLVNANTTRQAKQAEGTARAKLEEAEYWQGRIAGAIRHAAYKDRPDVIGRRIKGLEKDQRKQTKNKEQGKKWMKLWQGIPENISRKDGEPTSIFEAAKYLANYDPLHHSRCWPASQYPKSTYEGERSIWSVLDDQVITGEEAQEIAIQAHTKSIAHADRWLTHLARRLEYEKAYLTAVAGEEKAEAVLAPKPKRVAVAPDDGLKKGDIVTIKEYNPNNTPVTGPILSMGAKNITVKIPEDHPNFSYYSRWSTNKKGEVVKHVSRRNVTKVEA